MNLKAKLHELKLIQLRALCHNSADLDHCHVKHNGDTSLSVTNENGSGWGFSCTEYGDDPAYQTLRWLSEMEAELNRREQDMTGPEDLPSPCRHIVLEPMRPIDGS